MRFKKTSVILLAAIITIVAAACSNGGTGSTNGGKEETKLLFWNSGYKTIDENDKTKKKEDFYIYQAIDRFEEANPGVTVEIQDIPGGDELFTKFKTAGIAKNGPDITILWSGGYTFGMKQFLEPLDSYLTKEDKNRFIGWSAATEGLIAGQGTIYGLPFGNDGITAIFYNKKLFAKAGIDMDASVNYNDLIGIIEKLAASGLKTPLAIDEYNFWFMPSYWIGQTIGQDGLAELAAGKRKFNDPQLANIVAKWSDLYTKGFVSTDQPNQIFIQGKAAMTIGGYWVIPDARKALGDDLGMMRIPNVNGDVKLPDSGIGGVGSNFVITNYSKHKKEAVDFIKFLSSKEEQENKFKAGEGTLTVVTDVDIAKLNDEPLMVTMQEWASKPDVLFYLDNTLNAEVAAEITKQSMLALKGQLSPEDFLKKADEKTAEVLAASK